MALFGPSGAGKSTMLAAIAGLLRAEHAEIWLDGTALHMLPPERRGIGFVFQDGRLFPHLSVAANLAYGLRRSRCAGMGLDEVAGLLGITALLPRRPATLSGGERQRVALGRALLAHPRLLLMDEPLAALDTPRRQEIMPYLRRITDAARVPALYVTHARDELVRLADHCALIEAGRLVAFGPLPTLLGRADLAWAREDDAAGLLEGTIAAALPERRLSRIDCGGVDVLVPLQAAPAGTRVRLLVPARDVILALEVPMRVSVNNVLRSRVMSVTALGDATVLVELALGGGQLLARVTQDAARRLGLTVSLEILALVKSVGVEVV